jgi:hypothetical protein
MINIEKLERQFRRMGARVRVTEVPAQLIERRSPLPRKHHRWAEWVTAHPFSIDILRDKEGECFTLRVGDNSSIPAGHATNRIDLESIQVLDVQPKDRHLVLRVVCGGGKARQVDTFLCGHDERHWFVARTSGTSVQEAKEDLKPTIVRQRQARLGVKRSKRNKRKNEASSARVSGSSCPHPSSRWASSP